MGLPVILTHETEERNSQRVCLAIVSHITSKSSSNLAYYEAHICISHANIEIDKTRGTADVGPQAAEGQQTRTSSSVS
jgi:hypothetical protein